MPQRSRRRTRGGVAVPPSEDGGAATKRAQPRPAHQASGQQNGQPRRRSQPQRHSAPRLQEQGPLAVLAMALANLGRARVTPSMRAEFQAAALLLREQRVEANTAQMSPAARAAMQKRVEGLAASLARVAARDGSLFELLAEGVPMLPGTNEAMRVMRAKAGVVVEAEAVEPEIVPPSVSDRERQVIPQSAVARTLANPFLAPDFSAAAPTDRGRGCSSTGS